VRHTPAGTTVRVSAGREDELAELEVGDDGAGIPERDAKHVFQRFYRVDGGIASGSGLGLAIAHELAELMGGSIRLTSRPGRTVFTLALPAAAPEPFPRENVEAAVR
jgi:two-component system OmpR family sensor kinase